MNEQRTHDVVSHLQHAAIELIEAARAFLDVAEDFVTEPPDGAALASAVTGLARLAKMASAPAEHRPDEGRVERIRVS